MKEINAVIQYCARCRREAPDQLSDEFLAWEALGDGTEVICPGCITPEEQQAIDDDAMQMQQIYPPVLRPSPRDLGKIYPLHSL